MHMYKMLILLGASAIALGAQNTGAEARKRTYEIHGQRYTYETRDPAQVALARKRIDAANAVDAAKAKAEAEQAKNPLASVFGSAAQREAAEAQARLQQALTEGQNEQSAAPPREPQGSVSERQDSRKTRTGDEDTPVEPVATRMKERTVPGRAVVAVAAVAEPLIAQHSAKKVKSISFDVETGIKTTVMVDGSVEEEPFDSSTLSHLLPESGKTNGLVTFVKQLRKVTPEDATGSILPPQPQPSPGVTRQP